ncbi:hypothetical protein ACLOJK_000839 [Asimina triloba]
MNQSSSATLVGRSTTQSPFLFDTLVDWGASSASSDKHLRLADFVAVLWSSQFADDSFHRECYPSITWSENPYEN